MLVARRGRFLIVRFSRVMRVLSWAIGGGGFRQTQMVVWFQVRKGELTPEVDAVSFLRERLRDADLSRSVRLMTGTELDRYADVEKSYGALTSRCIATVGLSNALAVGDPPTVGSPPNTVNLLYHISVPLSRGAMVEAVSLVAEARTAAFLECRLTSPWSGRLVTGTGTDCIVVACPIGRKGERYAGKHTLIGSLIGQTVREAVLKGIQDRLRDG
jgi:adenosylcobinamide amidohydrolase